MPSYIKRGTSWRAQIMRAGRREGKTFPTKREAIEWATQREAEIMAIRGGKVLQWKFAEVLQRYADEISPTKAGERWEKIRIKAIQRDPIAKLVMQDITPVDIAQWRDRRLMNVQGASVLREINLLKAIWSQARRGEWHYVDHNPWKEVVIPKGNRPRNTIFNDEQVNKIVQATNYKGGRPVSHYQQPIVALLFSLETAMRAGEIISLVWNNVDFEKRIAYLPKTKNGDFREVPLSSAAISLLKNLKGIDENKIFTITSAVLATNFRRARIASGIEGLTFHDARATAITRLSKKLDILELARMVGHRDPRSLMIYYRKSASEIADKLD